MIFRNFVHHRLEPCHQRTGAHLHQHETDDGLHGALDDRSAILLEQQVANTGHQPQQQGGLGHHLTVKDVKSVVEGFHIYAPSR